METKPSRAVPTLHCLPVLAGLISLQLALSAAPAAPVDEPSWPGWRGPQRDARIASFVPPETWPENLERVWRVEVGEGYATPLIVGKRIYQHARQWDEEVIWCLDRETGKPIWRRTVPVGFTPGRGGERHGLGPKSTPATADGRVFTLSITGLLSAWSANDGKPLWQRDFRERFELAHPYWGTATSPVVEDGRLYVHTGSCENGALFCIDPETGKDLWEGEARAGDNAQFLAIPGHVLALTDRGALHVLRANPEACDILITYQVAEDGTWTAPALVGDALFTKDLKHLTQWRMPTRQADPIPADKAAETAEAAALAP